MTNFLRVDTNKGNKVDGGFRHTVFQTSTLNGKSKINILSSIKFDEILTDRDYIVQYIKNPDEFLKGITDEDDTESGTIDTDGNSAA